MSKATDLRVTNISNTIREQKTLLDEESYSEAFNALNSKMVQGIDPTGYNNKGEPFWSSPKIENFFNKTSLYFDIR
jgi:hypothetical protein